MKRTKLDEIVEEELKRERDMDQPLNNVYSVNLGPAIARVCKRIAERAFRHGVERCAAHANTYPGPMNVQPAPAEEKKRCECGHEDPGYDRPCLYTTYKCEGGRHPDRRKGERRKK